MSTPKYSCQHCGKQTSGRKPKENEGTDMLPRRHNLDGSPCPGNDLKAVVAGEEPSSSEPRKKMTMDECEDAFNKWAEGLDW